MRRLSLILAVLPSALLAEDIPLKSAVSSVVLYPQGASITREVAFAAPAGDHSLIFTDLPENTPLDRVRVALTGAQMGAVTTRNSYVPPVDPDLGTALQAAEDEITRIEDQIAGLEDDKRLIGTEVEAARARVAFLQRLGDGDGVAALEIDALKALSDLVGGETQLALRAVHEAGIRIREVDEAITEAQEALDKAVAAKRALLPNEDSARAMLSVAISGEAPATGTATITYITNQAGWQPVYDMHLSRETSALEVVRGAFIGQHTGENWQDVQLTLSTARPSEQTVPGEIWPWQRRIFDPEAMMLQRSAGAVAEMSADHGAMAEPVIEPAPMQAKARADGISVSYAYPAPVTLVTDADQLRIELGRLSAKAEITARAVPLSDEMAFVMARFTNSSDEVILPGAASSFYLDGRFIGQQYHDLIPAGGEAALPFGPIDGLRLTRIVKDRQEGDRGVITKSNELVEEVEITVENLTGESWPIELHDRVPYSEQEDLSITWQASPSPTAQDLEGKRGVLEWRFDLGVGETSAITLGHRIEWPEGMMLQ